MKNNNLGTKKAKEGNDMKNIIEVSNDETSSENISSISENETNSEYGLNDKTSFDKQRSKFGNKNIDISQLLSKSEIKRKIETSHHKSGILKVTPGRNTQSRYLRSNAKTERDRDFVLKSKNKNFQKFQEKLMTLDINSHIIESPKSQVNFNQSHINTLSPGIAITLPDLNENLLKGSSIPSIDLSDKQSLELLSEMIKENYGISDDLLHDVHLSQLRKWKMDERMTKQHRYVIMLKRIIRGKAKVEEFQQEDKSEDHFSNSIIANFLSDLLSKTSDKFINDQLRGFRREMIKRNQKRKFPHVFARLQSDAKKRKNDPSPKPSPSISKTR